MALSQLHPQAAVGVLDSNDRDNLPDVQPISSPSSSSSSSSLPSSSSSSSAAANITTISTITTSTPPARSPFCLLPTELWLYILTFDALFASSSSSYSSSSSDHSSSPYPSIHRRINICFTLSLLSHSFRSFFQPLLFRSVTISLPRFGRVKVDEALREKLRFLLTGNVGMPHHGGGVRQQSDVSLGTGTRVEGKEKAKEDHGRILREIRRVKFQPFKADAVASECLDLTVADVFGDECLRVSLKDGLQEHEGSQVIAPSINIFSILLRNVDFVWFKGFSFDPNLFPLLLDCLSGKERTIKLSECGVVMERKRCATPRSRSRSHGISDSMSIPARAEGSASTEGGRGVSILGGEHVSSSPPNDASIFPSSTHPDALCAKPAYSSYLQSLCIRKLIIINSWTPRTLSYWANLMDPTVLQELVFCDQRYFDSNLTLWTRRKRNGNNSSDESPRNYSGDWSASAGNGPPYESYTPSSSSTQATDPPPFPSPPPPLPPLPPPARPPPIAFPNLHTLELRDATIGDQPRFEHFLRTCCPNITILRCVKLDIPRTNTTNNRAPAPGPNPNPNSNSNSTPALAPFSALALALAPAHPAPPPPPPVLPRLAYYFGSPLTPFTLALATASPEFAHIRFTAPSTATLVWISLCALLAPDDPDFDPDKDNDKNKNKDPDNDNDRPRRKGRLAPCLCSLSITLLRPPYRPHDPLLLTPRFASLRHLELGFIGECVADAVIQLVPTILSDPTNYLPRSLHTLFLAVRLARAALARPETRTYFERIEHLILLLPPSYTTTTTTTIPSFTSTTDLTIWQASFPTLRYVEIGQSGRDCFRCYDPLARMRLPRRGASADGWAERVREEMRARPSVCEGASG